MPSQSVSSGRKTNSARPASDSGLARFGLALATWSERWFPDPLVFALAGIVIVFIFGLMSPRVRQQARHSRRQEFLDPGALHHADGDDHHWRIRRRHHARW